MKKWYDVDGWFPKGESTSLQNLARDKICVEIGNYNGRSTLCIAEVAKHVYAIDIYRRSKFEENAEGYPITIYVMSSVDGSTRFAKESVELIFVDGNHLYEYVKLDILSWWDKLKFDGVMCFHDYKAPGHEGVKQAVDEFFESDLLTRVVSLAWVTKTVESSKKVYDESSVSN